jgi:hypothetical protein
MSLSLLPFLAESQHLDLGHPHEIDQTNVRRRGLAKTLGLRDNFRRKRQTVASNVRLYDAPSRCLPGARLAALLGCVEGRQAARHCGKRRRVPGA